MKNNYKTKVRSVAKISGTIAAISVLALTQPANMVFAEPVTNNGDTSFPFNLTLNPTDLDVTVTDSVAFGISEADSNDATVSSISIDNELQAVPVIVSNIRATAAEGFTLQPFDSDFRSFAVDSNNFGIAFTGFENTINETHDLSGEGYDVNQEISASSSLAFNFKGLSSVYSQAKTQEDNAQIANIILTIGMKEQITTLSMISNMQDMTSTICANSEEGEKAILTDTREGGINSYWVGKAADGNCWMLQNLRLGSSVETGGSIEVDKVNNSTGEIVGTFTLSGKVALNGKFTNAKNNGAYGTNDSPQFACKEEYGCYYNWTAATAGSLLSTAELSYGANYAPESICPSGWSLPSKEALLGLGAAHRPNVVASSANNTEGSIPGFTLGGSYNESGYYDTRAGSYWTSYTDIKNTAQVVTGNNTSPSFGNTSAYRYVGHSVRCMAN